MNWTTLIISDLLLFGVFLAFVFAKSCRDDFKGDGCLNTEKISTLRATTYLIGLILVAYNLFLVYEVTTFLLF